MIFIINLIMKNLWNKTTRNKKEKTKIVKKKKPRARTRSREVKDLDMWFSRYIRILYARKDGMVQCVTSKKWFHRTEIQLGHFITRGNYKYRRDPINCYPQCYADNIMKKGNYIEYTFFMIGKYWINYVEFLKNDKELVKISTAEIREMIEKYKWLVVEHPLWQEYLKKKW